MRLNYLVGAFNHFGCWFLFDFLCHRLTLYDDRANCLWSDLLSDVFQVNYILTLVASDLLWGQLCR